MRLPFFSMATLGMALQGCSAITACDASVVPAISLTISDQTGAKVTGQSTIIWTGPNVLVDSLAIDLLTDSAPVSVGVAAGDYSLTVRHAGYSDWHGSVTVSGDRCKPRTASVAARLTAK